MSVRVFWLLWFVSVLPGSMLQQGAPKPPWGLGRDDVVPITLSAALCDQLDLEYEEGDTVRGAVVDLNGDGVQDFIVRSAPSLCGNAVCVFQLLDGASGKDLGQVTGNPLYVQPEKVHGYPVITTYSREGAESGTYTTYAFDGSAYAVTATKQVAGAALDSLVAGLRRIALWKPWGGK